MDDMLLAPFLGTRDLLRLSETATWLVPYRNQLGEVKINAWSADVTPAMIAMMSAQKRLHTVSVGTHGALAWLVEWLQSDMGVSTAGALRRLVLPPPHPRPWLVTNVGSESELGALLRQGGCPKLEELGNSQSSGSHLWRALEGCPELRCLAIAAPLDQELIARAAALAMGLWPKLQTLHMRIFDRNGGAVVTRALKKFPRPALRELYLTGVNKGLGDALRSGACRGLRRLNLPQAQWRQEAQWREEEAVALGEALGEGACPDLTELNLSYLPPLGAEALAHAIRAKGLARLEVLSLGGNHFLGDGGAVPLMQALGTGGCPRLRRLILSDTRTGDAGCVALAQAMGDGGLPSLEELVLTGNPFGDRGAEALEKAFKAGVAPNLKKLDV
jgi:hypothetical protein